MQCPSCGFPKMKKRTGWEEVSYGGTTYYLPNIKTNWCPRCYDSVYDTDSYRQVEAAQTELIEEVRQRNGRRH